MLLLWHSSICAAQMGSDLLPERARRLEIGAARNLLVLWWYTVCLLSVPRAVPPCLLCCELRLLLVTAAPIHWALGHSWIRCER